MTRIAYQTPMVAYDHIADMLKGSAGNDGLISRNDAKGLVHTLTKEGRGTEAMLARNLFKMIDAQDNTRGARITGFDLEVSRKFVEKKMLQGYDLDRNGWSKAEIAKMSPTARGLIELGRTMKINQSARISHATPERGMDHIAALLTAAKGNDSVIGRSDVKALSKSLYAAGRGTEALAVDYFCAFIDHRDSRLGARITAKDIVRAVEYSGTKLLRNHDTNNNGYSRDEYQNFSTTAKAFTLVGKMIEVGIVKSAA